MEDIERVRRSLFNVIDEFNQTLPAAKQLPKALDTALFGENGALDSLGLVNLIVATEQRIEEDFGVSISLADERAMSQARSPFRTVDSLVNYIGVLLKENVNQ
jgi:acyl carrier protein